MDTDAAVDRAELLISQNRYGMAKDLLHQALASDPDHARGHAWLAWCLAQDRDQLKEATREAELAVFLAPDVSFTHSILAEVWENRNQLDKAHAAIDEAIAIHPDHSTYHGMKARLYAQGKKWKESLESAETGLSFDPEDESCGALRSHALERLGKVDDAGLQADELIRQNPDSSWAHSSRGWTLLQQGDYKAAQTSFAEALRLEPSNEFARNGMIQTLNSSNFLYRWFYLLMSKVSRMDSGTQWVLIIGLWLGMRFLGSLADKHPSFAPWILPIMGMYLLLVIMSWIMQPLFNTLLRFHPYGKHLLSAKEKWASNLIALTIGTSILLGAILGILGQTWLLFVLPVLLGMYLTIPIVIPFNCEATWARGVAIVVAITFAVWYLGIHGALFFGIFSVIPVQIYMLGILIYCFVGQILTKVEPKY